MSQILKGTYKHTLYLDQGTIGASVVFDGTIQPGYGGGAGVFAASSVPNAYLVNIGTIAGGSNGGTLAAGAGVYFSAAGTVTNAADSTIYGGNAGNGGTNIGFAGGAGVDLNNGGELTNQGTIFAGNGGFSKSGDGGAGGFGFGSVYGPTNVTNLGTIHGGNGGMGDQGGGDGGIGVFLDGGGTLINGSADVNSAKCEIFGGSAGKGGTAFDGDGVLLDDRSAATNFGAINGGRSGFNGHYGGIGVLVLDTSNLTNAGLINGGGGSYGYGATDGAGGIGVELSGGSALSNTGFISGGYGGNSYFSDDPNPGTGGIGLFIAQSNGSVINTGEIVGGNGGGGYNTGGTGGAGVSLDGGGTFTNTGFIIGGGGGFNETGATGGAGAAGVYLNGGTLITSGAIGGGHGGNAGNLDNGPVGDAIQFGPMASTLIIEPGANFNASDQAGALGTAVVANPAVSDVLELAGTTAGNLNGLGSQFTGFKTVTIEPGANWTLGGLANIAQATETLNVEGTLTVSGDFVAFDTPKVYTHGLLQAGAGAELSASTLTLAGGVLACSTQGDFVVGTSIAGVSQGAITLDAGAKLSGFGTIASKLAGAGTLAVTGGSMLLQAAVTGSLVATVAASEHLDLAGGGTLGSGITGSGTLILEGTSPYTLAAGKTLGLAGTTIEAKVALGGEGTLATVLANSGILTASGGTLTLQKVAGGNGTFAAASGSTLDFAGGLTTAGTLTGAGTLLFAAASTLDEGANLLAAKVLETANITLGTKTSLTNAAGHSFDIAPVLGGTVTLTGAAGDIVTNASSFACTGAGTADVNTAFVNAQSVTAGSGKLTFLGSVTNSGTMSAGTGTLTLATEVLGTGNLTIGAAGTLALEDGASASQTVQFGATSGLLDLTDPLAFDGAISDFGGKDQIDLLNTASTTFTFASGTLTIENGSATVAKLDFAGAYTKSDFAISSDAHGGTLLTFV